VSGAAVGGKPVRRAADDHPIRRLVEGLPRPLRYLGAGGLGLLTDLAVFTLVPAHYPHALPARLVSLELTAPGCGSVLPSSAEGISLQQRDNVR
jgi:hypothetical protein